MVLAGKISTEVGVRASADKFFHLFSKKLHDVQNHCERVHETILHEGDDWHVSDSVKQWTYVIGNFVSNSICFIWFFLFLCLIIFCFFKLSYVEFWFINNFKFTFYPLILKSKKILTFLAKGTLNFIFIKIL